MNHKSANVSLIIAVYNGEKTLEACLDSALMQKLDKLEIIVINDGSTDRSQEIIDKYVGKHPNIKGLKNEQNMGAGYSKNRGVNEASGKFLTFLDADDYIGPEYLDGLYKAILKTGSDIAVADIALVEGKKRIVCRIGEGNRFLASAKLASPPLDAPSILAGLVVAGFWGAASTCTKLARKELWVRFPFFVGKRCDDVPVVLPMLAVARQIVYVPECCYNYVQSTNSVERSKSMEKTLSALVATVETAKRFSEINAQKEYLQLLCSSSVFALLCELFNTPEIAQNQQEFLTICNKLHESGIAQQLSAERNPYLSYLGRTAISPECRMTYKMLPFISNNRAEQLFETIKKWKALEKTFSPKVSIIIPVYNGANYMRYAIDSALAQTYKNIEVIVVNDGSTDDGKTEEIAKSYGDKIRYFYKENGGVATALNFGIEKMQGEYFSWLSHDDMYTPSKIAKELECLFPLKDKTTIIAEGYQLVDKAENYICTVNLHNQYPKKKLSNPLFPVLRGGINGCALLIHRSHFERVGGFNPELPTTQDYDLWFRMFRGQNVYYAPTNNVLSRCHEEQDSKAMQYSHAHECNQLWINMMDGLTDEERVQLDGSPYLFYCGVRDFLMESTGYTGAIAYAQLKSFNMGLEEYERTGSKSLLAELALESGYKADVLKDILLPIYKEEKNRKRIVFILSKHGCDENKKYEAAQIAPMLTDEYDVFSLVVKTGTLGTSKSVFDEESGITQITLHTSGLNTRTLTYACYLLNPDLIVCDNNCVPEYLAVYSLAKSFGIHAIAWNNEFYFSPYWNRKLSSCLKYRNEKFADADAVVWLNAHSQAVYAEINPNGVCLMDLTPFETAKRSETQFDILNEAQPFSKEYNPENVKVIFSDVIDAVFTKEQAVRNEYFAAHFQPEIENKAEFFKSAIKVYEECVSRLALQAYRMPVDPVSQSGGNDWYDMCMIMQQSRSWKITKPLRLMTKALRLIRDVGFLATLRRIALYLKRR